MNEYRIQIKKLFQKNQKIDCPAFTGDTVILNAKGINHLIYKGNRSRREKSRIETNIRLLPRAIEILKKSTFWQEESHYIREKTLYKFWAFEAVVNKRRVKVIIRQVNKGKKHFWSVIPAWRRPVRDFKRQKKKFGRLKKLAVGLLLAE